MKALMQAQEFITASEVYKATFGSCSNVFESPSMAVPIEVSYSEQQQVQLAYFLRLLKQANEENRWIMFIGQDALLDKRLLINAGIDINKVLLLRNTKNQSKHLLMAKALEMGNCSAVIVAGEIESFNTPIISMAAEHGKTLAFVLNQNVKAQLTFH
ncbi:cell division protein FtsZ [Photobacterium kishitanii]|uniref:Cell division protein FtsZ n=1 Tax=Photobacterium kishitanii TaxID=318456 RepID=A0A0B7J7I8_9GAMM|nr:SulA-like leucine-rich domain-containing protein [Photobacterium kishitanii]OBU20629.1 cell division protein FtsZ [Photobacterium kishitanii]PSU89366.1 cell division protein FtsZ [Photobacterium kishitanii]PSU93620.1 cell division protein FtsZ [Photobacterium kishitanii]PSU98873.1 cell division protein FtsZ [Photobacterium kishitanii]PSV08855.1 cell division protein FtsZ [Photobacterium kishitanii]